MYGDARHGKLSSNIVAFGRALRRAGVAADAARLVVAEQAAVAVGIDHRADFAAALEAVLVSKPQDIAVFRELFDAYFRNPEVAQKLLSQLLPQAEGKHTSPKQRPRVREALAPQRTLGNKPKEPDKLVEFDAAMSAGNGRELRHADFNQLTASEYTLVMRLATQIALPVPQVKSRRTQSGSHGARLDWGRVMRQSARTAGELIELPRRQRAMQALPLLILVDVSGSMERYARLLLAFLHAATPPKQRQVFAFGTQLTDLNAAFKLADTDAMLKLAGQQIADFAGGTQLGAALAEIRAHHARGLVGKRTVVLLISDGLDTGEPLVLAEQLQWLKRRTGRLVWLNPLLRFAGYAPLAQGAAVLHREAHCMLAVHNIDSLEKLAKALAAVLAAR